MDKRLQRVLDGELAEASLTAVEREELAAIRAALRAAVAPLDAEAAPDVADGVMWRVRGLTPDAPEAPQRSYGLSRAAALLRWLLTPQPVRLRPAAVFGVLATVAVSGALFMTHSPATGVVEAERVQLLVQFRLSADNAREVALVGSFSGWEGQALEQVSPGVWTTTVALEPGLYDYAFVIDGERWQLDPLAPAVADGFGGANSRVAVLAPEPGAL